ncbi:MAG: CHAD domain-containing protein [Cyanobacteria bacterium P01_H01_bin.26]
MQPQFQPVGTYAHQAIQTHFSHIRQQEKSVLAHGDPEFLHQMRVGLRRLRTAHGAFEAAIVLPAEVNEPALKRLGKVLGRVRDLDVLQSWLTHFRDKTNLSKSETKVLRTLIQTLKKRRKEYVVRMEKYLHSKDYKHLVKAIKKWLKHPQYQPLANLPLAVVLPDLLLPMLGQLLLHPGWLVTDDTHALEQVHDLRKQIKGLRYQMVLFSDFYGEAYKDQVGAFKQLQDLLGKLQDEVVLQSFLVSVLGDSWMQKLPSLERYFQKQHQTLWQQWLTHRQSYLSLERRDALYQLFLPAVVESRSHPMGQPLPLSS